MLLNTLILLLPAICYLIGAMGGRTGGWKPASASASMALLASAAAALALWAPVPHSPLIAAAPLNLLASLLVSLVGFIVVRYSVSYLAADPAESRYRTWLQLCLASVSLVVVSDHLLLFTLAWSAISICLHQLLMCYPDRFRAVLAAHKKFIFARLADLSLLSASLLLWHHHGTFQISTVLSAYPSDSALTLTEQAAAVCLAAAALIKCAQLPVHGWLMQVVEAPTPVSALLHAGVINLGGFLMILMAPLMNEATPARWLLLLVAGPTAVLAALIMMTRISIKVRLAWSTSAQMGLMLVECALGLHELALLHLIAHSCYKAHAFLSSGSEVWRHLAGQNIRLAEPRLAAWARNLGISAMLTGIAVWLLPHALTPPQFFAWTLVAIAVSFLLPAEGLDRSWARGLLTATLVITLYALQKELFSLTLPASPDPGWAEAAWALVLAVLLVLGYGLLIMHRTALSYRWRQWLFAGLYLDEWVTRTSLKIWPVQLPAAAARKPGQTPVTRSESHEHFA